MADTLPCPDGAGSINNTDAPAQVGNNTPYQIVAPTIGTWDMSAKDYCADTFDKIQNDRSAEMLNINGAPLNIYKLLGVHEQGDGDITASGTIFGSQPFPGYPVSNMNSTGWRSLQTGSAVSGATYVGVDFGNLPSSQYAAATLPSAQPKLTKIGAIAITQGNTANNFARQVRVETNDGTLQSDGTPAWKRQGVFNLVQSGSPVMLNLQRQLLVKSVRVIPTLFTGSDSWEISGLKVFDSPPTDINNIQDLFFNENRDRDYAKIPLEIKAQYSINNSITDLSKFGLNILDQYSFTVAWSTMTSLLGRPIVTGDIIEVTPELQYDHNLKPVRKFLEVTDTGWAAEGYSPTWKPTMYRFAAQQAIPSQETRDIFGTIDTQKYVVADNFFSQIGVGTQQIDPTPLTQTEEIAKLAQQAVPETGDDIATSTKGAVLPPAAAPVNLNGQPEALSPVSTTQNIYIEDGLPPPDQPYGEGYTLPDATTAHDGDYFRMYYPESLNIAPRLYRFSAVKNKWIYMETDRRIAASSFKPAVANIMQSSGKQSLKKKLT